MYIDYEDVYKVLRTRYATITKRTGVFGGDAFPLPAECPEEGDEGAFIDEDNETICIACALDWLGMVADGVYEGYYGHGPTPEDVILRGIEAQGAEAIIGYDPVPFRNEECAECSASITGDGSEEDDDYEDEEDKEAHPDHLIGFMATV